MWNGLSRELELCMERILAANTKYLADEKKIRECVYVCSITSFHSHASAMARRIDGKIEEVGRSVEEPASAGVYETRSNKQADETVRSHNRNDFVCLPLFSLCLASAGRRRLCGRARACTRLHDKCINACS